jgi:hypothetical protein
LWGDGILLSPALHGVGLGRQQMRRPPHGARGVGAAFGHKGTGRRLFAGDPRIAVLVRL